MNKVRIFWGLEVNHTGILSARRRQMWWGWGWGCRGVPQNCHVTSRSPCFYRYNSPPQPLNHMPCHVVVLHKTVLGPYLIQNKCHGPYNVLPRGWQPFSVRGQGVRIFSWGAIWSLLLLSNSAVLVCKQLWTIWKQIGVTVFQLNFTYGWWNLNFM